MKKKIYIVGAMFSLVGCADLTLNDVGLIEKDASRSLLKVNERLNKNNGYLTPQESVVCILEQHLKLRLAQNEALFSGLSKQQSFLDLLPIVEASFSKYHRSNSRFDSVIGQNDGTNRNVKSIGVVFSTLKFVDSYLRYKADCTAAEKKKLLWHDESNKVIFEALVAHEGMCLFQKYNENIQKKKDLIDEKIDFIYGLADAQVSDTQSLMSLIQELVNQKEQLIRIEYQLKDLRTQYRSLINVDREVVAISDFNFDLSAADKFANKLSGYSVSYLLNIAKSKRSEFKFLERERKDLSVEKYNRYVKLLPELRVSSYARDDDDGLNVNQHWNEIEGRLSYNLTDFIKALQDFKLYKGKVNKNILEGYLLGRSVSNQIRLVKNSVDERKEECSLYSKQYLACDKLYQVMRRRAVSDNLYDLHVFSTQIKCDIYKMRRDVALFALFKVKMQFAEILGCGINMTYLAEPDVAQVSKFVEKVTGETFLYR